VSFYVFAAGCGGMVYRGGQGPVHCGAESTGAGLWFSRQGRTAWLAFACDQHADDLIAARPLLPRDGSHVHLLTTRSCTGPGGCSRYQNGPALPPSHMDDERRHTLPVDDDVFWTVYDSPASFAVTSG
jgi:hypothetical protein